MNSDESTHQIKNAKGLFIESHIWGVTSVAVAQHLREHALPLMQAKGLAPLADYAKALDALQALPELVAYHDVEFPDANFDEKAHEKYKAQKAKSATSYNHRQADWVLCHGWSAIGSAKGASNYLTQTSCSSAKEAGWLDIGEVAKRIGLIDDMLEAVGIEGGRRGCRLSGAATAAKRGKELAFEKIELANQYAETESFLLFVKDSGYLDDKGSSGPLSRARAFESAAAAARTAGSRRIGQWKIVKAAMAVIQAVEFKGDTHCDEIAAAVAHAETKALERALESASVEKLRERLAELEAKAGSAPAPVAVKKPRL